MYTLIKKPTTQTLKWPLNMSKRSENSVNTLSAITSLRERFLDKWEHIINTGNGSHLSTREAKNLRLLNGISTFASIGLLIFAFFFIDLDYRTIFYESLLASILFGLCIWFNAVGLHRFSIIYFITIGTLIFSYLAVTHGEPDGTEYILFCTCVSSMLFYKNFKIITSFFVFNVACFWIVKYLFGIKTAFVDHGGGNLYILNHTFTFIGLFLIVYYFKSENSRKENLLKDQNGVLHNEKAKSEELLLNILPSEVATELKENGYSKPNHFESVSVLFTDFVSFTKVAETMSAQELVHELNTCFSVFDDIVDQNGIEKIKTIGDSYMCADGLTTKFKSKPEAIINTALQMQQYMIGRRKERMAKNLPFFEMRIGIHNGPVVAGIVGLEKFAYDIWGETVNIASRMESFCEVDQVNISKTSYELIKDSYPCQYRGKVNINDDSQVDMYYVQLEA